MLQLRIDIYMLSSSLESDNFDISLYLELVCKKHHSYYPDEEKEKLEIDFIALEKELSKVQTIQERTCEQIVQFVDQNRERFIEINGQLQEIQEKVGKSQNILKLLGGRIDEYKSEYYLTESKIQRFINQYELKLIKNQVISLAKAEAKFLGKFNIQFEQITNKEIKELNLTQKYLISRFTFKLSFIKALYEHHIVKQCLPDFMEIGEIVTNLADQLEFYLGEQLAKYQSLASRTSDDKERGKVNQILNQIRAWYMNLGKQEQYFRLIERNTIEREMQNGEKLMLSSKTALLSGKDYHIMESVFTKILSAVAPFPDSHPKERLKALLFSFFKKDQLKFLYTYAMPIFPLAYRSYFKALQASGLPEWLKKQLQQNHGWSLKMWIQVRQKNIIDRSNNDTDLLKWIQIIFKSSCMLPGTLSDFTRLAFRIVNRYLSKMVTSDFLPSTFTKIIEQSKTVGRVLSQKIRENAPTQDDLADRVHKCITVEFQRSIDQILNKSLHNIASSCQGSLQPVKSFVSKIIKKDKQFIQNNTINKSQNLFKPLHGFLKNNSELSPDCISCITHFVQKSVVKHYDTHYAPDIFSYSKDHLISEQVSLVMEVVGRERTTIFKE